MWFKNSSGLGFISITVERKREGSFLSEAHLQPDMDFI